MHALDLYDDVTLDGRTRDHLARVIAELELQWPQLPSPIGTTGKKD